MDLRGRFAVDSFAVAAAIGILIAIGLRRHRRAAQGEVDREAFGAPDPTDAEMKAAERSIREKTALSVQDAKRDALRSAVAFVICTALTLPFISGMPLHSFFRPWGQLLLIGTALSFAWAGLACLSLLSARSFHREAAKFLDSLEDGE